MHEFSIARRIVEIARQHLPPGEMGAVKLVKVKLGDQAGIAPESLRFCFEAACEENVLRGVELEITVVAGDTLVVSEVDVTGPSGER